MTLTADTLLVRSPEPLAARIDDEVVMLDVRQGRYFGLDSTASAIWELLETPRSVDEICANLLARYEVTDETCRAEVTAFLTEAHDAGLVRTAAR